ncbi:MAG: hypothetical protein R3C68_01465 [Myxococcota bacterium]
MLCCNFISCNKHRPALLQGSQTQLYPDNYRDVLRTWTRQGRIYQNLESKLFANATFHSPELRRAFAASFPEIYGHGGDVTRRELVELGDGVEQFHTFFLSAYTAERKWNDFNKPDSIWRLTLINSEGVSIGPAEIIPIKIDANIQAVYGYIGHFDEAYLVRFNLTDGSGTPLIDSHTRSFTLRIASALGKNEMHWKLQTPEQETKDPS